MHNCLSFRNAKELSMKIYRVLKEKRYRSIQQNAHIWALSHTCTSIAKSLLERVGFFHD